MGLQPDRENDQVELFGLKGVGLIDKRNLQVVVPGILSYPGEQAAHIADPMIFFGPFIITIKALALGPDIDKKDRRLDSGNMFLGNDGLLGGIHTANIRTIILMKTGIPGTDALDPAYLGRFLMVGRPLNMAGIRSGGGQETFKFQAGNHIGVAAIAVFPFKSGIKGLKSGAGNNGAHIKGQLPGFLIIVDGPGRAEFFTGPAVSGQEMDTVLGVDGRHGRYGLRKWLIDIGTLREPHVKFRTPDFGDMGRYFIQGYGPGRADKGTGPAGTADFGELAKGGGNHFFRTPVDQPDGPHAHQLLTDPHTLAAEDALVILFFKTGLPDP